MRLLFDDITHTVESAQSELFKCKNSYQFKDLLCILLDETQLDIFWGNDTKRSFAVSKDKIKAAKEYMNDNIWNDKRTP